jgi:hypothetical protein
MYTYSVKSHSNLLSHPVPVVDLLSHPVPVVVPDTLQRSFRRALFPSGRHQRLALRFLRVEALDPYCARRRRLPISVLAHNTHSLVQCCLFVPN